MSYFNDFQAGSFFDEPSMSDSYNGARGSTKYSNFSHSKIRSVDKVIGIVGNSLCVEINRKKIYQPLKTIYEMPNKGDKTVKILYKMSYLWDSNISKTIGKNWLVDSLVASIIKDKR